MHANRLWRLLFVLSRRLLNVFKISTEPFRKGRRGEKIFEGHPYGFLGRPVTATRFRPEPSVNRSEWLTPDYRRRGEKNGNREGGQSGFVRKIKLQTNRRKSVSRRSFLVHFVELTTVHDIAEAAAFEDDGIASIGENGTEGRGR